MTASELIEIAGHYYPASFGRSCEDHGRTAQTRRFEEGWDAALATRGQWLAFCHHLQGTSGRPVGDVTAYRADAGYRCALYVTARPMGDGHSAVVVGCASILAPICFVYAAQLAYAGGVRLGAVKLLFENFPPDIAPHVARTRGQLVSTFGTECISPELARTPLPGICDHGIRPGPATVLTAFFCLSPEAIP